MALFGKVSGFFLDLIETIVVALSIFLVVYLFFMQPHQVKGQSMEPTFSDKQYLLTDKVSYQTGNPQRGDVVVFHAPEAAGCPRGTNCDFIKRVIGVPGDSLAVINEQIVINGQVLPEPYLGPGITSEPGEFTAGERTVYLGENEYFMVGDNRPFSSDSRVWGPVGKENIVGRAFFRYLPVEDAGIIPRMKYAGFDF